MNGTPQWRTLSTYERLDEAQAVTTSIAAMEFDVRLIDAVRGVDVAPDDADSFGPYHVDVRPADWAELVDVLDQIEDEQVAFDTVVEERRRKANWLMRWFFAVIALALATLVVSRFLQ